MPGAKPPRVRPAGRTSSRAAGISRERVGYDAPLVQFTGVWRFWGRGQSRWAVLRNIHLNIQRGEAICVEGNNGVGKTTLLRIATGILAPNRGTVTIGGIEAGQRWRDYHRQVGFLSAGDRGLYQRVTVRGHLDYWTAVAFVPRRHRRAAVDDALARFGLGELAGRRVERLSQGQRQRLRIALAVVHRPQVVLLDEPRNSLDADGQEMLRDAVASVLERGGSVVWCSPVGEDQPMAFDRVLRLEGGRLHRS